MKPYVIEGVTLTDYEGRTLTMHDLKHRDSGLPIVERRPPKLIEDDYIAAFNRQFQGERLWVSIKLITRDLFGNED